MKCSAFARIEARSKAAMLTALDVDPAKLDLHEQKFVAGIFKNCHTALLPVSKRYSKDHLGCSRWFYRGDNFDCVQLIWTDRDGRFRGNKAMRLNSLRRSQT